ncbi:hypothetical protein EVAR_53204_1 [Eumeta japonica]|uniref:Uncharacterized protein n=1 Tax=Eumeta variegata TaxID=151549 RepID=A0A4C1XE87_EUMVA|nr:hypothetical protein EVAR_53204_1 [Eumeta japonica]
MDSIDGVGELDHVRPPTPTDRRRAALRRPTAAAGRQTDSQVSSEYRCKIFLPSSELRSPPPHPPIQQAICTSQTQTASAPRDRDRGRTIKWERMQGGGTDAARIWPDRLPHFAGERLKINNDDYLVVRSRPIRTFTVLLLHLVRDPFVRPLRRSRLDDC